MRLAHRQGGPECAGLVGTEKAGPSLSIDRSCISTGKASVIAGPRIRGKIYGHAVGLSAIPACLEAVSILKQGGVTSKVVSVQRLPVHAQIPELREVQ